MTLLRLFMMSDSLFFSSLDLFQIVFFQTLALKYFFHPFYQVYKCMDNLVPQFRCTSGYWISFWLLPVEKSDKRSKKYPEVTGQIGHVFRGIRSKKEIVGIFSQKNHILEFLFSHDWNFKIYFRFSKFSLLTEWIEW